MPRPHADRRRRQLARALPLLLAIACSGDGEPLPVTPAMLASTQGASSVADTVQPSATPEAMAPARPVGRVVDSIVPIEVALERFRDGLAPVHSLSGGAGSTSALADALIHALEHSDSSAIRALVLDRAEFAYIYYPHTDYLRPPRNMSPALLWLLISENSEKGATRLVRRLAGRPLDFRGINCPGEPHPEGPNRLWVGCTMAIGHGGDDAVVERRIFGSILERDGRFKFVSYTNDF